MIGPAPFRALSGALSGQTGKMICPAASRHAKLSSLPPDVSGVVSDNDRALP